MRRIIFHIDVNSAFLSWSAVKLVAEGQPDIRLVPSVISGDPSDRRSIITAASIPAKKLGIKTAQPVSMALRACPTLVIARGDWDWYKRCSEDFISICRSYSPVLQQFSIDECFIDMSLRCAGKDPVVIATQLKDEIRTRLGFTVNVGVGSNKLLAKMASDFEKPDKVHTLWGSEVQQKMWPLGVRDLLWVGKKTEERLVAYGIKTIGDLAKINTDSLTRIVGRKSAVQLHENANGRDDSPVETAIAEAKSYSAERTFAKDLSDAKDIDRALFNVACVVAHRIRRDSFRASTISVFVKYNDFSVSQRQCSISQPTDITAVILNEARRMIREIWDGINPIRQVGLGLSKLTHEAAEQMMLFEDPKMDYYREWDRQYDECMEKAENARTAKVEGSLTAKDESARMVKDGYASDGLSSVGAEMGAAESLPAEQKEARMDAAVDTSPAKLRDKKTLAQANEPLQARKLSEDILVFKYPDGEKALSAAKKAIKTDSRYRFHRIILPDGTDCFEVVLDGKVIERHTVEIANT